MHVYIDESGTFTIPTIQKRSVSCVAALILPSSENDEILDEFDGMRSRWLPGAQEIKGRQLNEAQVAEVIDFLRRHDALVEVTLIDTGMHTEQQITDVRMGQAHGITNHITPEYPPDGAQWLRGLGDILRGMSNQLFVQAFLTISLIENIVQIGTLYYSQRMPEELGEFHWFVDAKQANITKYEYLWTEMMMPLVQARTVEKPFFTIPAPHGDYSFFERFYTDDENTPTHLKPFIASQPYRAGGLDFRSIMREHFVFEDSKQSLGLQLVDVIANAVRRACNGKLRRKGWKNLGSLIVSRKGYPIDIVYLTTEPKILGQGMVDRGCPYANVILELQQKAKSIWTPENAPNP